MCVAIASVVFLANITTALYLATINRIGKSSGLNSFGLMWCNGLVCGPILLLWTFIRGDMQLTMNFPDLYTPGFMVVMLFSCILAFFLNYFIFLNTTLNSALTQTMCGNLKDLQNWRVKLDTQVKTYKDASDKSFDPIAPLYSYCGISLINVLTTTCQYEALKYVSFPVQTLAKCAKMIPVMLWSTVIMQKKYNGRDYVLSVVVTVGCFIFILYPVLNFSSFLLCIVLW